jgi:serine/threonine protein kinase
MDAARWKEIDQLFDAALEISESERADFVVDHAGNDEALAKAVNELLAAQKESDTFLMRSAMRVAADIVANEETEVPSLAFLNKTIATYRVEKLLGAGGMGEVYLAFDEKLKRKVALKILPAEFGSNDERVKRFELEARAISSLNHPNIVTIYDIGNFEGVNYIATEFVEGKTLRDLMGGKFKIRNILINSIQICDALSAAHNAGIIHRDIKPENVMIRKDGYAKILDFGLAKLTDVGSETLRDIAATTKGVIIGTPAYMSPAQISDEKVDHRTDLWSCGVVLYEFLTGKNPFKGASRQETFEAILSRRPEPCSLLNPAVPVEVDRILAKLMEKDPTLGYQSAAEIRADLKRVKREIDSGSSWGIGSGSSARTPNRVFRWPKFVIASAAIVLITLAVAVAVYYFSPGGQVVGPDWSKGTSLHLTNQPGTEYFPSISPDGKEFVYAAEENGNYDIFVQRVGAKSRTNLTPNSPASDTQPAFSPDGERIAFRSDREPRGIYVMGVSGDDLRRVADFGFHPSWSPNGREIVVSTFGRDQPTTRPNGENGLWIIDLESGARRELTKTEATFPSWSPRGHRIAFWFYTGTYGRRDIATIPAGGGEPIVVAKDFAVSNWNPVWSPDGKFLYFVSSKAGNMNFWRVGINEITGETLTDPEPVVTPSKYSRHLSFSRDGTRILYVQTNNQANIQGVELDLKQMKTIGEARWLTQGDREVSRAELSPDGSRFVMRLIRPTQDDIVTANRDGGDWRDITNDEPFDRYVRWSPDGTRFAFLSDRMSGGQIWITNADGTGLRQLTYSTSAKASPGFPVWSPDGKRIAVYFQGITMLLDPDKPETEQPDAFRITPAQYRIVVWDWSPDGTKLAGAMVEGDKRHIGYYSLATNDYHIIVPGLGEVPSWTPDSRHLIYSQGGTVHIVNIETKVVRELFKNPAVDIRSPFISRDGKLLYYTAANAESDIWMLEIPTQQ